MRYERGFTIVEILISVTIIVILASVTIVSYSGLRAAAIQHVAESNLQTAAESMEIEYQLSGTYPTVLPDAIAKGANTSNGGGGGGATTGGSGGSNDTSGSGSSSGGGTGSGGTSSGGNSGASSGSNTSSSGGVTLTLKWSGTFTRYSNLSPVQNGVLLSQICQTLIDEGAGKGVDKGGNTQTYIMGCGNWNHNSMQVTGWDTRVWNTPVTSDQLLQYASSFTTSDSWNSAQIGVVKNFYTQLAERQKSMGGSFPITSFWDSWANSGNGGVIYQALPSSPQTKISFCIEASADGTDKVWHISDDSVIREGACDSMSA